MKKLFTYLIAIVILAGITYYSYFYVYLKYRNNPETIDINNKSQITDIFKKATDLLAENNFKEAAIEFKRILDTSSNQDIQLIAFINFAQTTKTEYDQNPNSLYSTVESLETIMASNTYSPEIRAYASEYFARLAYFYPSTHSADTRLNTIFFKNEPFKSLKNKENFTRLDALFDYSVNIQSTPLAEATLAHTASQQSNKVSQTNKTLAAELQKESIGHLEAGEKSLVRLVNLSSSTASLSIKSYITAYKIRKAAALASLEWGGYKLWPESIKSIYDDLLLTARTPDEKSRVFYDYAKYLVDRKDRLQNKETIVKLLSNFYKDDNLRDTEAIRLIRASFSPTATETNFSDKVKSTVKKLTDIDPAFKAYLTKENVIKTL